MPLKGFFSPPGDKSISHRVALMSLLATGRSMVENFSPCADVRSSLESVELLGGVVSQHGSDIEIKASQGGTIGLTRVDCGNSGTTMRLLMGILAGKRGEFILDGDESLRKRPMERVASPLRLMGASVECRDGRCPVKISGTDLHGIRWDLPVASAQLKSAILLAGIQAGGTTSVGESIPSRDHTERLLGLMGATISRDDTVWNVSRSELFMPEKFFVPGDASSAAFFLCAAAIVPGSDVTAEKMLLNPTRIGFLAVLRRMGAVVEVEPLSKKPEPWGSVRVRYSPDLAGCRIAADEIPSLVDEVPILALVASQAKGVTVFEGVGELRVKESDRLAAIASQLGLMGARIAAEGDTLTVDGPADLVAPEKLDSFGDHRIAMTLRLACLAAGGATAIAGEESVGISYPGFHDALKELAK